MAPKQKLNRKHFQYCTHFKTKPHLLQCYLRQAQGEETCLKCPKISDPIKNHMEFIKEKEEA